MIVSERAGTGTTWKLVLQGVTLVIIYIVRLRPAPLTIDDAKRRYCYYYSRSFARPALFLLTLISTVQDRVLWLK